MKEEDEEEGEEETKNAHTHTQVHNLYTNQIRLSTK